MPRKDVTMSENDALPLEYKLNWGRARRQVDAGNFMNHPLVEPEDSVLGLRLSRKRFSISGFVSFVRSPIIAPIFD